MTTSAPGSPGIEPKWTSSAKEGVGTALSQASPVWFTLSHGILNEVYYPRIDQACLRDAEFLVVTPDGRFFEEKRDGVHTTRPSDSAVSAFCVDTADPMGSFVIEKRYVTDPDRPTLLVDVTFRTDQPLDEYTLVFLAAPHLENHGSGNTAWVADYKGTPMLYAQRGGTTMAIASTAPLVGRSVGYVGVSDAWQDLSMHSSMQWHWDEAADGNVAMAFQPDLGACGGQFSVAIGFGATPPDAGIRAVASLRTGFATCLEHNTRQWRHWIRQIRLPAARDRLALTSATVLASHEAKSFSGGLIASLSIPWGFSKGDGDLGGYHLVWPRDHAEAAGALFAIEAHDDGLRALSYLRATQEADGHWAQNMWLNGSPYWSGVQMDETALPILLVDLAHRSGALTPEEVIDHYWPMVRNAASYIVSNGPVTAQDRWEEDGGYSSFTLATEISALLSAADMAEDAGELVVGKYLRETADCWDAHIEGWCYVTGTALTDEVGVDGCYVRIGPSDTDNACSPLDGWVPIKNRPPGADWLPARSVVSPDALALVRFGLRAPDDPRIVNTIRVIDATLREDFGYGPGWRRYSDDGYGEHDDGSSFDGTGTGRVWPLLTGERGHYEVAAGRLDEAEMLAETVASMAGDAGLLPEQTWDGNDIPDRELFYGKPAGSAMPLVWAHAEYLKLLRSIEDEEVFDLPRAVKHHVPSQRARNRRFWRKNHKIRYITQGTQLRIELTSPATVHWTTDGWTTAGDLATSDTGVGMYIVDLDTVALDPDASIIFTMHWEDGWENRDYRLRVTAKHT